jgi:hypothetical protein
MNRYGQRLRDHLRASDPDTYRALADPDRYFTDLGNRVAETVNQFEAELLSQLPRSTEWVERHGQANMARLRAEELALAPLLTPTADSPETAGWEPLRPTSSLLEEIDQLDPD